MSLEWLANNLSGHRSTLVVDGTGLKGLYEFEVDFEFDRAEAMDKNVPEHEAADPNNHSLDRLLDQGSLNDVSLVTDCPRAAPGFRRRRASVRVV